MNPILYFGMMILYGLNTVNLFISIKYHNIIGIILSIIGIFTSNIIIILVMQNDKN